MKFEWRMDNTDGYTQAELAEINAEWQARCDVNSWCEEDPETEQQYKRFCDEVAGR